MVGEADEERNADMFKKMRLSTLVLLLIAAVLLAWSMSIHGCVDMDEALPHYEQLEGK